MSKKVFCYVCGVFDGLHHCKLREIFVKPNRARFCQNFVDKTKILKPKEEIPQPVKIEEKVPVEVPVAPVKTQLELTTEKVKPEIKKVSLIRRILNWLIRRVKCLLRTK